MGIMMPTEKPAEQWDLNRYLKSIGLTGPDVEASTHSIEETIRSQSHEKRERSAIQSLKSMGMSEADAEAWMKARKKGRSFMMDRNDKLGEHLDRILERNAKTIYAVDTILYNTILSNSFMATSRQRII